MSDNKTNNEKSTMNSREAEEGEIVSTNSPVEADSPDISSESPQMTIKQKIKRAAKIVGVVLTTCFVCFLVLLITTFAQGIRTFEMADNSMEPTIMQGSTLVVRNIDELQRNEVAVYEQSNQPDLVHRIVAVPGDRVEFKDQKVFINGQEEAQNWAPDDYNPETIIPEDSILGRSFTVPADRFLMLGDNRDESIDSRFNGLIDREDFTSEFWFHY